MIQSMSDVELLHAIDSELEFGWTFRYTTDGLCAAALDDVVEGYGDTMRAACEALLRAAIERRHAAGGVWPPAPQADREI